MQVYKQNPNYLVSYDIKDDQIIQHYYNDSENHPIPNIPHNVEACDRQLLHQFQEFKKDDYKDIKIIRNLSISNLVIPGLFIIAVAINLNSPILYFSAGYYHVRNIIDIIRTHKKIKHYELTDFCLEHATEIKKLLETPNHALILSEKAQNTLNQDQGFTLNHSDKYLIKDLKQLQKALGSK